MRVVDSVLVVDYFELLVLFLL
ncbi:hypothetical protein A2U01_0110041, partial [Trifolium medium]|nr:hypothetical protein [Trifolium medium]